MVQRLEAAGVRSISNIVDITNYVLLETGHPIHAFDLACLDGQRLVIRTARPGESITTLDGQPRPLATDMLVIADATRPQAVAGVMGGAGSEVSASTRTIAIESAYFQPASVRRTSKRLGLSTEASYRFERGADVEAPLLALARACELIEQLGAGTVRHGVVDAYPGTRPRTSIQLERAFVARMLGTVVADDEIERILVSLGCDLVRADDRERDLQWTVTAPTWRNDLVRDVDLVEEVARHHGYDHLPVTFPTLTQAPAAPDPRLVRERAAKASAARAGFSEAVTFTFIERAAAEPFATSPDDLVAIANPLSEKFAVLRPSLLPGLIDSLAHNRRREQRDVRLYESGTRFSHATGESRGLALGLLGAGAGEHWSGTGRDADFFDIKGALEMVAGGLGLRLEFEAAAVPYLVAGRAAVVSARGADGRTVPCGVVGQVVAGVATGRGLPKQDAVLVAELDLDAVAELVWLGDQITARPLPRHPSVVRDLSILVSDAVAAQDLRQTIRAAATETLVDVREFARYQGTNVPADHVSLSFHLVFRAPERTLTDEEVSTSVEAILGALTSRHAARLR
jgi:phenylalanyl-tRNA synthetase beta chain